MIAAIVLSVLVVVGLVVVILVKRQPAANIVSARQLARAEGPVPGMELAAGAVPPRGNCRLCTTASSGWRSAPARSAA